MTNPINEALRAAVAYAETFTGNGCREQPADWAKLPNGDFNVEEIAKRGRAALASNELIATISLPISDKACSMFLDQAVSSGSTYWLACKSVTRAAKTEADKYPDIIAVHRCRDAEDGTKFADITLDTMRLGFQRLLAPGADVASNIQSEALATLLDIDSTAWDDWTCDAVLQFGLLGSLVYG